MGRGKVIDWECLMEKMLKEAKKRNAPVITVEKTLSKVHPIFALIFVVLSSRTRDENTLEALINLIKKYKTPQALAHANEEDVKKLISKIGFYKVKAKRIIDISKALCKDKCSVPDDIESLMKLPGVGRKTANVVLSIIHKKDTIGVDTHVHRISNRLGIVKTKTPYETEEALKKIVPKRYWRKINKAFVAFGQTVCKPKNPDCEHCPIRNICKYYKDK